MAILKQIQQADVKYLDFPEHKQFHFQGDNYLVDFSKPDEIRMGYYIREVKVTKNRRLFTSGQTSDPNYLELTSFDNRFMFLPFRNSYGIFDLLNGTRFEEDISFLHGNNFDQTNKYLLTVGFNELKLFDIEKGKTIFNHKDENLFASQAHFGIDNCVWLINKDDKHQKIEKINPITLKKSNDSIPSPFDFLGIDIKKYQKLIDSNKHCLWIKQDGGMIHSSLLDSWQYVKTTEKTVYKSAIPVTDIHYSENYKVFSCHIDYFYVVVQE